MQMNYGERKDRDKKRPDCNVGLVSSYVKHENSQAVGEREHGKDDLNENGRIGPETGTHLADAVRRPLATILPMNKR